jgi:thiol-disulfide isomerase/thioredoxin
VVVIAILAAMVYVALEYTGDEPNEPGPPSNMGPAPDFSIYSIDGGPVELEAYHGKVVVLDLFATWCEPCRQQMEELNKLRAEYSKSQVEIISVDVDETETAQMVRDFRDLYNADWTFCLDTDDLGTKYEADSIPRLAIIGKDGNLYWTHVGIASLGVLKGQIDPLLKDA